ncbi:alpha/beta hydrolase-fold protein [Kribbella sp. NPDC005582]|uniref:alpha/beta hydrolase-fold protein n=1 Tax=Kribbella sp. NPDC005582 TaxID=3156893 RepID=UPI0033AAF7C7
MSQSSHAVTLRWTETDHSRPALDVLVRLVALTDDAYEAGDLTPYLMNPGPDGEWTWTAELPADLRTAYQVCPVRDLPVRGHQPDQDRWLQILAAGVPDPEASAGIASGTLWGNPGPASVLELPAALPQPWLARRPEVPTGEFVRIELGDSVIHVWKPATSLEQLPVVITFDGGSWVQVGVEATFANLVADRAVPRFVGVLIESINGSEQRGPTRVRSLTHPDQFADFVLRELLPYLRANHHVTDDPERTVLAGQSLGGLAAAHVAAVAPDQIGWVIGQSAALWWPGDDDGGLSGAAVVAAYENPSPTRPHFFLEVGSQEGDDLRSENHRLHQVLQAGGHTVSFREYRGGHDLACWQGGLADGIITALQ